MARMAGGGAPFARRDAGTEVLLGLVQIVSSAAQGDRVDRGFSTGGIGNDMVELEKAPLGATASRPDERTAAVIPGPDGSTHSCRDTAGPGD